MGTTLFPIIIIAVNALYLHRQGRLSTFAGEHCSAKVEHSHRSRWCRIVYHLTAMSSYEGYQFAVSLLGCLSFIGYRCGSPLVLRYRRSDRTCLVVGALTLSSVCWLLPQPERAGGQRICYLMGHDSGVLRTNAGS